MEKVYVPKDPKEKAMQRALIQYRNPKNHELVVQALEKAGRTDLIGYDKKCLIRPMYKDKDKFKPQQQKQNAQGQHFKKKTIRNVHKKKAGKK